MSCIKGGVCTGCSECKPGYAKVVYPKSEYVGLTSEQIIKLKAFWLQYHKELPDICIEHLPVVKSLQVGERNPSIAYYLGAAIECANCHKILKPTKWEPVE